MNDASDDKIRSQALSQMFDLADFDGNGSLDVSEVHHMIRSVGRKSASRPSSMQDTARLMLQAGGTRVMRGSLSNDFDVIISRAAFQHATNTIHSTRLSNVLGSNRTIAYVRKHSLVSAWISGGAQVLLTFHAPVSAKGWLYFDCKKVGAEYFFLRADYQIKCYEGSWFTFLPFAVVLLGGFALGMPLLLGGYMTYHRRQLRTPMIRERIGFLMGRYKAETPWWEIVDLVRKMVLTGLLIYLPPTTRAAAAVLLCLGFIIMLNYFRPHVSMAIFWVCQFCYLLTTVKYLFTTFRGASGKGLSDEDQRAVGVIMIMIDVAVYVGGVVCMVAVFWHSYRSVTQTKEGAPEDKTVGTISMSATPAQPKFGGIGIGMNAGTLGFARTKTRKGSLRYSAKVAMHLKRGHASIEQYETTRSGLLSKIDRQQKEAQQRLTRRIQEIQEMQRERQHHKSGIMTTANVIDATVKQVQQTKIEPVTNKNMNAAVRRGSPSVEVYMDPATGRQYSFNPKTGKTAWLKHVAGSSVAMTQAETGAGIAPEGQPINL